MALLRLSAVALFVCIASFMRAAVCCSRIGEHSELYASGFIYCPINRTVIIKGTQKNRQFLTVFV